MNGGLSLANVNMGLSLVTNLAKPLDKNFYLNYSLQLTIS